MSQYYFIDKDKSPRQKQQTSGSFGFKSSQFSQKKNNSIDQSIKNIDPSIFNESSIKQGNDSQSGDFIYFQNDSVLSQLQMQLNDQQKAFEKPTQKQLFSPQKKKQSIDYNKSISFEDSLQKTLNNNDSGLKQYGTDKQKLPPTLKKPKFGFKVSQTAQSSQIIRQVNLQYQLKSDQGQNHKKRHKDIKQNEASQNSFRKSDVEFKRNFKQSLKKQLLKIKEPNDNQRSSNNKQKPLSPKKYNNGNYKQDSISSIRKPLQKPSVISNQSSKIHSINSQMNFKSVFKQKLKVQKASSINSSLNKHLSKNLKSVKSNPSLLNSFQSGNSISKQYLNQKSINVIQLKDFRQLQNKLGELKYQNKKIIEYMIQKDGQIQELKKKKIQIQSQDPYAFIKQNELMKAFLNNNKKVINKEGEQLKSNNNINRHYYNMESPKLSKELLSSNEKNLHSAKSLKQVNLLKSSNISSLHDYDVKEYKFKVLASALTKQQKKIILSNRGMLLSQKYLDVGYSLKDRILTIYMTLKSQFQEVRVKLEENSLILSEKLDRVFKNSQIERQIKFKTQIQSTKCQTPQNEFVGACLKISLCRQEKFQNKLNQFKVDIPITVYNMARQMAPTPNINSSERLSRIRSKQIYKTQYFVSCKQMIRNPNIYLSKLFPVGVFEQDMNVFHIGFVWKEKSQNMRIKIKQRSFVIQGEGNPNKSTFQILRAIVNLLIEEK